MTMASNCPICGKRLEGRTETHPFCSPRCRAVDLGAWLGGEYLIADAPPDYHGTPERASEERS
ncbi:MAG: DNA gyrase inhibitor YacG [Myxococcota bacterium]